LTSKLQIFFSDWRLRPQTVRVSSYEGRGFGEIVMTFIVAEKA